jgi:pre-mRNA-splicing factor CWC26
MSLSSYLASKYLNAEPPAKKRKRKHKGEEPAGLVIADDDSLGWSNAPTNVDDDEGRPLTINAGSAEFRKAKKNAWKTVGVPALQPHDSDAAAADAIINQAAAENANRDEDEQPVVEDDEGIVKMGDGTHAGLQSGKDVARQFEKRKREEAKAWEAEEQKHGKRLPQETIYRDATGKRIDLSMRRAEARKELDAKAKKELEEKEAQRGDVQILEKAKRREELDEARFMPVARTVDDKDMNDELKEQDRWNDPAAQFLTAKKQKKSATGKPIYQGAAAPNRYGIRPGHRWDGVDRGNGWESERFKALNRAKRNKDLNFAWQEDV